MRCNNCNYEISGNSNTCSACGTNIVTTYENSEQLCPNCHAKIDINMSKCAACGFGLKKLNIQQTPLTSDQQEKLGKSIGKLILIFSLIPLIPFILVGIGILIVWLVSEKIFSFTDVIIGIKYLLIILSVICFFFVMKNINNKSGKKIVNMILGILGIIFIAPVIYFSFFSRVKFVDLKDDIIIQNYNIPTLYKYTKYDDSLFSIQIELDETTTEGKKLEGDCVFNLYYEKIPKQHVELYKQKLMQLGYENEYSNDEEIIYLKKADDYFNVISIYDSELSYCVIKGQFEDYKGEWSE